MKESTSAKLAKPERNLLNQAEKAMKHAFNPGSGFAVGAAVVTASGKIFSGANMNISSTGLISCAEVAAFLAANTAGERDFTAIAVIAKDGKKNIKAPNLPCGRCCQIIHEFNQLNGSDIEMIYSNTKKDRILMAHVKDFFPHAFVSRLFRK